MSWHVREVDERGITVEVPEIVGKQRPRTVRNGGTTLTYTPQKTRDAEELIAWQWRAKHGDAGAGHDGPVFVSIDVTRELAKSNPRKWAGRCDLGKPDLDNVGKLVLDALNGIAYPDDSHIVYLTLKKRERVERGYGNTIGINITYFEEYEEED